MSEQTATLIGGTAVFLWGALALFTTYTGMIPPFQLVAMTFAIAFLLALGKWILRWENPLVFLRYPAPVWVLGIGGLFGYHFFYFMALKNAPPVDASLIAYLWPLLIVLFSALLPGERLRWFHVLGALMGLGGCALLVTNGGQVVFDSRYALGYLAAIACALTWSGYSVLSRRFGEVPTDVVGWFCGATAVLGLLCHAIFETTVMPEGSIEWLAVVGLGLGPVGAAFFTWDVGVKRGNIRALGAMSYMAPLISAVLLVLFGRAAPSWVLAFACVAIVGGALLASLEMLRGARAARK
ncbi:aromatic amino acid exporter YddG [Mariluticola halotolerans]|uniref:aromatic amino acid exporter YddG n=1 Tax=Mariluticola halotolerans TaxID=2909283 RepID=UPI0026E27038|nr:DMT family transporter [Mariluticola halotolerans]UJQ94434.1 DMT family transporter [Mariluticola halotolerans]